jgi:DNA-directed RNA polymerase specialized sigma24 family protein
VKKQDEVSQTHATETIPDDRGDARARLFHEIVRDGRSIPDFDALERKEVLPLLAQRIAELPLMSKKILAMCYYENLSVSEIAACFNLPARRIDEILTQTVGLLGNYLLNLSTENADASLFLPSQPAH